jgi:hypothetical protein
VKTFVATLSQKPLWEGDLPPIGEGMRLVVGAPGSQGWIVNRAFIHLAGNTTYQAVYVVESSVHDEHDEAPGGAR